MEKIIILLLIVVILLLLSDKMPITLSKKRAPRPKATPIPKTAPSTSVMGESRFVPPTKVATTAIPLTEKEQQDKIRQKELLEQWKSAEAVFIYMPLHNFNVVSKFKDYIDNIMIVNETFKCEVESLIGLDDSNKQITFIITSGGEFDKHIQYINLDFAVQYVRGIFSVIGIDKVKVLRVEGLDLAFNNKEQLVKKAIFDLKEWIDEFSSRNK